MSEEAATNETPVSGSDDFQDSSSKKTFRHASIVLAAGVFAIDYYLPFDITGGIAYVVVVLVSLKHGSHRFTVGLAVACAVLTVGRLLVVADVANLDAEILKRSGFAAAFSEWISVNQHLIINRLLAIFAIWVTAAMGVEHIRYERKLQQARDDLELRVEERTQDLAKANTELRQEITDREQAEQASRDIEDRTGFIIDHALDAIIGVDTTGGVVNWNHQAETTFGWSRQEALGELLTETIIPEKNHEMIISALRDYESDGENEWINRRFPTTVLRRDGDEFDVELSITPVPWGDSVLFSIFIRDLSERRSDAESAGG